MWRSRDESPHGPAEAREAFPAALMALIGAASSFTEGCDTIEREKSMIYLTVLGQNKHVVSWIFCRSSVATLRGNDRRQSVQVNTTYGIPRESFPFRGIHTGADSRLCSTASAAEL